MLWQFFPTQENMLVFFQWGHLLKMWFQKYHFWLLYFGELDEVRVSVLCRYHMPVWCRWLILLDQSRKNALTFVCAADVVKDGLVSSVKTGLCLGHRHQEQEWDYTPHYEPHQCNVSKWARHLKYTADRDNTYYARALTANSLSFFSGVRPCLIREWSAAIVGSCFCSCSHVGLSVRSRSLIWFLRT